MIYFREAAKRGRTKLCWLESMHSFSFGEYVDPTHRGFSVLRVINDDVVQPGAGFQRHGHRDMEILTYVLRGEIEHKDSMGHALTLSAGELQLMSAGTGIEHSEFNASTTDSLHFLQIWIEPDQRGAAPRYQQKAWVFTPGVTAIASPKGADGGLLIRQDVSIYHVKLEQGESFSSTLQSRSGYLHAIQGEAAFGDRIIKAGDGVGVTGETVVFVAQSVFSALWFDLPKTNTAISS